MFHVGVRTKTGDEALSISISGAQGLVGSVSGTKAGSFGLGRAIQPGAYTVTVGQQAKGQGGTVVIADAAPVFVTGWQIWSRTYVGLLAISGLSMVFLRRARPSRARALNPTRPSRR